MRKSRLSRLTKEVAWAAGSDAGLPSSVLWLVSGVGGLELKVRASW